MYAKPYSIYLRGTILARSSGFKLRVSGSTKATVEKTLTTERPFFQGL